MLEATALMVASGRQETGRQHDPITCRERAASGEEWTAGGTGPWDTPVPSSGRLVPPKLIPPFIPPFILPFVLEALRNDHYRTIDRVQYLVGHTAEEETGDI